MTRQESVSNMHFKGSTWEQILLTSLSLILFMRNQFKRKKNTHTRVHTYREENYHTESLNKNGKKSMNVTLSLYLSSILEQNIRKYNILILALLKPEQTW